MPHLSFVLSSLANNMRIRRLLDLQSTFRLFPYTSTQSARFNTRQGAVELSIVARDEPRVRVLAVRTTILLARVAIEPSVPIVCLRLAAATGRAWAVSGDPQKSYRVEWPHFVVASIEITP
jgi:hypothetical protein